MNPENDKEAFEKESRFNDLIILGLSNLKKVLISNHKKMLFS